MVEPSHVLDVRPAGATSRADSAGEHPSLLCWSFRDTKSKLALTAEFLGQRLASKVPGDDVGQPPAGDFINAERSGPGGMSVSIGDAA